MDPLTGLAMIHARMGCNAACSDEVHAHVFEATTDDVDEFRQWLEEDIPEIEIVDMRYAPEAQRPDDVGLSHPRHPDGRPVRILDDEGVYPYLVQFRLPDFSVRILSKGAA